ncbi:MAG: hypothetical protein OXG98_14845 [Gemmatimonadetes bacterium]|nr:hypothetical protein [Gemmatimonadota bacterium]
MSAVFIALLVLMNSTSQANQQETDKNEFLAANDRYAELVEKLKADVTSVDFDELRRIYVKTEHYAPYASSERKDRLT